MNGNNPDVYLFDSRKRLRQAIVWGVSELIHAEDTFELNARIDAKYDAKPGEYLGFLCVDGRFRLFRIDTAEYDDAKDLTIIEATDAAVSELAHTVAKGGIRLEDKPLSTALDMTLDGSGFVLGTVTADTKKTGWMTEYYPKRWKALRSIAEEYDVRVIPYYEIADGEIVGKKIDVLKKENVFRGRLIEGATDSQNIAVILSGVPVIRMYGIGKSKDQKDPPDCVTFEDVVWKKSSGDPADKPSGQAYIEDPDAIAEYGDGAEEIFEDKNETDGKKLLQKAWEELQRRKKPQVSGVATVSDMEMVEGYEHKKIRMYDKVIVRTRRGMDAESTIIAIRRNYIEPTRTRITLGEETKATSTNKRQSITQKVASMSGRGGSRSSGVATRYIETKQLIQLNANTIQANANEIFEINSEVTSINSKVVKISGTLEATVAKIGSVEATDATIDKLLSGKSEIEKLNVRSLELNGRTVRGYTVTIDGEDWNLFGWGN